MFFLSHVLAEIQPRSPRSGEKIQPHFSAKTAAEGGEKIQPRFSGFSAKIAAEGGRKFPVPLHFCSKNRRRRWRENSATFFSQNRRRRRRKKSAKNVAEKSFSQTSQTLKKTLWKSSA